LFIEERKDILSKNEMCISNIIDILVQEHTSKFIGEGEQQGIVNVTVKGSDEGFSAFFADNLVGFIRVNGKPCNLFIKIDEDCGRLVNKDLNLSFQYKVENFDNDIKKISIIQNIGKNEFFQSYLCKDDDAIIIGHAEKVDKSSLPKEINSKEDIIITVENNNLINVTEEEILEYAEEWDLGTRYEQDAYLVDENTENEYDEEMEYIYEKDIEGENIYEEKAEFNIVYDLTDEEIDNLDSDELEEMLDEQLQIINELINIKEENIDLEEDLEENIEFYIDDDDLEDYRSEYSNIVVKENNEVVDEMKSYEIIDNLYEELLNEELYVNDSIIYEMEDILEQVQSLFKLRTNQNKENDFER
jgi:hypothetical protein